MKEKILEKTMKKLPPSAVCEKINKKLKEYKDKNPSVINYKWNKESNKFVIKSSIISGEIVVLSGKIQIYVDSIPLLLRPFKNQYIKLAEKEITKFL